MTETRAAEPDLLVADRSWGIFAALARQQGHLFAWLPVCLGCGVGLYFALRFEPDETHYKIASIAGLAVMLLCWRSYGLRPFGWAALFMAAGFALAGFRAHQVDAPVLTFRYYGPIEGRVITVDRSASEKIRLTLDRVVLDRMSPERTPKLVRVSLHGDQPFLKPEPGMTVIMTGHLSPPSGPVEPGGFDFQRSAWFKGLGAVGYTRVPALLLRPAECGSAAMQLYRFRLDLSKAIKTRMQGREGPFASAILTGDRTDIDPAALEALRASNLAHLLAISGLHMGLLTGVIFALVRISLALVPAVAMRTNPKKIAAIAALVTALAYLGLSGASVATQRAFVMVAVMLVAICLDKRALTLRAVAMAALIVLVIRPESLTGPGFQMSFAATTALVATFAWLRDSGQNARIPRWARPVASLVISSGIAGLATAPFGAAHFNQVAHYGLLANLLSVPVMGMVVMPSAVLAGILAPLGLDWLGLAAMQAGLAWILWIAEMVSGWDSSLSLIPAPSVAVLPMMALGGAVLCLWQGAGRLMGLVIICAGLGIWSQATRPDVLIAETGRLIGVLSPEGRMLNKPKGDGFTARGWLENDGDTATQEQAATRGDLDANFAQVTLSAGTLIFDASKEITPDILENYCATFDIVIAPRLKGDMPCEVMTQTVFRHEGSVAIRSTENGLALQTNRRLRGDRLWLPQ